MASTDTTPPPHPDVLYNQVMQAFETVMQRNPHFCERAGQRDMVAHIAQCLSPITWPKPSSLEAESASTSASTPEPLLRALAMIQAGTGVGKSAAYITAMVTMALAHGKRLVISTATVALQEQLMNHDLPALSHALPTPFSFTLAKGRGRYVCPIKLEALAEGHQLTTDLLYEETATTPTLTLTPQSLADMQQRLESGVWSGDSDTLDPIPEANQWALIHADRHTCTRKLCPKYNECPYFSARAALVKSQVIVVNHALLFSTLGMRALPELDQCYLVLDEAHHLSDIALQQEAQELNLVHLKWLDQLPKLMQQAQAYLDPGHENPLELDINQLALDLKRHLTSWGKWAKQHLEKLPDWERAIFNHRPHQRAPSFVPTVTHRFSHGIIPTEMTASLESIIKIAHELLQQLDNQGTQLKALAAEEPDQAQTYAQIYSMIGPLVPKLEQAHHTAYRWLATPAEGMPPFAKWLQGKLHGHEWTLSAHASPLAGGPWLAQRIWPHVRSVVLTSATLTAMGTFDPILNHLGFNNSTLNNLNQQDGNGNGNGNNNSYTIYPLAVSSPFDYAKQGRLVVAQTQSHPRDLIPYNTEVLNMLWQDLQQVQRGALVLFTSKKHLSQALYELDHRPDLMILASRVLAQGQGSRSFLLRQHAQRIERGEPSLLFGLQSFGEGLDLPGALCEWVFITKIPFASPANPIAQAHEEWLIAEQRDPFEEIVLPATSARLMQWTGRAVRKETDRAVVLCYDPRLLQQRWGKRMLQSLPPFSIFERKIGGHEVAITL